MQKVLQKRENLALPLVVSALVLAIAVWLRYGLFEAGVFPTSCGISLADGLQGLCLAKWVLLQTFAQERLGWLSLVAGLAAFALRVKPVAWAGWFAGVAGLVLYSYNFAAVGLLLSLLVIVREYGRK
ncbi:MAG TPA: hypothetical protein VJ673_08660 [Aromatoleum sp.]|uniref:hypothetical protein n=1 Tax=Aromatoleum sp. TaxID=2307007 RepID=UPI002B47EC48|nr:hypothetical protein [Aromatoleum sp.]HJV25746.1 hypothetical protein [Aromatoleum sp.]